MGGMIIRLGYIVRMRLFVVSEKERHSNKANDAIAEDKSIVVSSGASIHASTIACGPYNEQCMVEILASSHEYFRSTLRYFKLQTKDTRTLPLRKLLYLACMLVASMFYTLCHAKADNNIMKGGQAAGA